MTYLTDEDVSRMQDELLKTRAKLDRAVAEVLRMHSQLDDAVAEREDAWGMLQRACLEIEMLKRDLESASRSYNLAMQEIEQLRETVAADAGQIYALGGRP